MSDRLIHTKGSAILHRVSAYLDGAVSNAPLVSFRVVFGLVMVCSTLRFWYLGWIEDHFVNTQFTFKYFGFYWVELLSPVAMYALHMVMLLAALGILLGFFYRWSAVLFFLSFTYVELIDITYYLNHYYFVSISSLLLIVVPAHRRFSLAVWRRPRLYQTHCPRWCILIFKVQIAIVYIYAGLAKINYDWLVQALPLKIWLPAHDHLPLIGPLLRLDITAYVFSWVGMLYDCTIVFFLAWRPTRKLAYLSVIVFHGLTAILFQIGVFPFVMMGATWIYFGANFHERLLYGAKVVWRRYTNVCRFFGQEGRYLWLKVMSYAGAVFPVLPMQKLRVGAPWRGDGGPQGSRTNDGSGMRGGRLALMATDRAHNSEQRGHKPAGLASQPDRQSAVGAPPQRTPRLLLLLLGLYFAFQLLFPWRYQLYPDHVFWTEEGYRFSWRVMLMEKAGTATFYVKDARTGREGVVDNAQFLRPHQEKQMAMQPDMIVQYAHFLADHYRGEGVSDPAVRAEVYVTLNARPSQLLIDPTLDLTTVADDWRPKKWILPYEK